MNQTEDERWMLEAIHEAKKGIGLTSPNPAVGAVIVSAGKEIARGWHHKAGLDHAEKDALAKLAPGDAKGATIYVTLEPCSTHGRTGACTEAIINAGITRVVYGTDDPNPHHVGHAAKILRAQGIDVETNVCRATCDSLIRGFAKVQTDGRPWIIAKTAMSLDGRITRPPGEGQWLTGPAAREEVQLIRAEVDAIITSGATVRADDPLLTLRSPSISPGKSQPLRVIITRRALDSEVYQIFKDGNPTEVFRNPASLRDTLERLTSEHRVNTVLLECGGGLMGSFLDEGLIDEMVVFLAPMVTGGPQPAIGGRGVSNLESRLNLVETEVGQIGDDLMMRGIVGTQPKPLER